MSFTRRKLLFGSLLAAPFARSLCLVPSNASKSYRIQAALDLRNQTALAQSQRSIASMKSNGDESLLPHRIACFAKGLPQNRYGEVEPRAYEALLMAVQSGKCTDFERIPRSGGRRLNNPQAAFTFHLEGGDPHTFEIPVAPSLTAPSAGIDAAELYWQALCRDVPFSRI